MAVGYVQGEGVFGVYFAVILREHMRPSDGGAQEDGMKVSVHEDKA